MGTLNNFQQLGKITMKIVTELLNNQNLCKLLYYTSPDPLAEDTIINTKEKLFNSHIQVKPILPKEEEEKSVVNLVIEEFYEDSNNPDFLLLTIRFDILCPYDVWSINDIQLRPFAIMEEIDKYMQYSSKTAIGKVGDKSGSLLPVSESLGGYSLIYTGIEFK